MTDRQIEDPFEALINHTSKLEDEAHRLQEVTDKKIKRATLEFRILSGLIGLAFLGVIIAIGLLTAAYQDLHEQQRDINALVEFVQSVDIDTEPSPELREVFQAVFENRELVCATEDPVTQEACAALQGP